MQALQGLLATSCVSWNTAVRYGGWGEGGEVGSVLGV